MELIFSVTRIANDEDWIRLLFILTHPCVSDVITAQA